MHPGLFLLGFIGFVLVSALMHVLDKLAGEREYRARRKSPAERFGDTITYS